jgi:hypothetical protein
MAAYMYIIIAAACAASIVTLAAFYLIGVGPFQTRVFSYIPGPCNPHYQSENTVYKMQKNTTLLPEADYSLPVRNVNATQTIRLVLEVYPYDAPLIASFYNSTNMEVARYSVFDNPKESSWAVYQGETRAVSSSDMALNPSVNTLYISYGGNYDMVIKNTGTHHLHSTELYQYFQEGIADN